MILPRILTELACGILLAGLPVANARADLKTLWSFDSALTPGEGISGGILQGSAVSGNATQKQIGRGSYFGNNGGYASMFGQAPDTKHAWAIAMWLRTDADNGTTDTLCSWYGMPGFVTHVFRRNSGNLLFQIGSTGYQWPASLAFDREWHHVVVSSAPGGGAPLSVFLDGVAVSTTTSTSVGKGMEFDSALRIGAGLNRSSTSSDWDGWIDDYGVIVGQASPTEAALMHGLGRHGIGLAEFPVARALASAPAGTVVHISGKPWIRVTSGLEGAIGSAGGSVAAGDARVVLADSGSGIQMATPPSPLREFTSTPERFEVTLGTGRSRRESLEVANPSSHAPLAWEIVAPPGEMPGLVAIDRRIDATLPGLLAVVSGLTAEVPQITAGGDMISSAYQNSGNYHRFKPSFASTNIDIPLKAQTGIHRQEYQSGGMTASMDYLNRTGPGFFMMSADCKAVAEVEISGNLTGAFDPESHVSSMELSVHGIAWKAWIYRLSALNGPIIHHVFLTPRKVSITGGIAGSFGESYRLAGLPESCRIHHLWLIRDFDVLADDVLLEASRALLRASHAPAFWVRPDPPAGEAAAAGTSNVPMDFDSTGLPAGTYRSRLMVIPAGTDASMAPESHYHKARINVLAPEFTAAVSASEIALLPGYVQKTGRITLDPSPGFNFGEITTVAAAPWLRAVPSENRIGEIDLTIDTTGLAEGTHETTVTISAGQTTQTVTIRIRIWTPSYTQLIADPYRNRVYLLHDGSQHQVSSRILVLDAAKGTLVREIAAGRSYLMAQSPDGARLFTLQRPLNDIVPIDLHRMEALAAIPMPEEVPLRTETYGNLQAGPGGVVYFINRTYAGTLFALDTNTGQVLQQFDRPPNATSYHDKLRVTADGAMLFASVNVSDTFAGPFESLVRYRIEEDGRLTALPPTDQALLVPPPLSSPYLLQTSASGRHVTVADRLFAPGRFKETMRHFPTNIHALGPDGEFVVCKEAIYNAAGTIKLRDMPLPLNSSAIAVTPEGNVFYAGLSTFGFVDVPGELGENSGFGVVPDDGASGPQPEHFRWLPIDGTREYRLHFSRNRAALASATPGSGAVTLNTRHHWIVPPVMAAGETWHWRVDAVSPSGLVRGPVRAFTVTTWGSRVPRVEIDVAKGCTNQPLPLDFVTSGLPTAALDYQSDQPWLKTTGQTNPARAFEIDTRLITSDSAEAILTITADRHMIAIPVLVRIHPCDHVSLTADRNSPRAYALLRSRMISFPYRTPSLGPYFLTLIDPSTGELRECRQVGFGDGKLFLSNDGHQLGVSYPANRGSLSTGGIDVFDSAGLKRLACFWGTTKDINYLPPSALGPDDLLAVDSSTLFNWRTGQPLARRAAVNLSSTVFSPDGRTLYSGDNERIYQYDATSPTLPLIKSVPMSGGAAPMISLDGTRLAHGSVVFDGDLNPVAAADGLIHALNADASLLITRNALRHVPSMRLIASNEFGSFGAAWFCDAAGTLIYQVEPGDKGVPVYAILRYDRLLKIDAGDIIPATADGSVVASAEWTPAWSDLPAAASFRVFFGEDAAEVAAATAGSPLELGVTTTPAWTDALPLDMERTYYWKVIAEGPGGSAESAVWSFRTPAYLLSETSLALSIPYAGPSFFRPITLTAGLARSWSLSTDTPWLRFSEATGTGSSQFTLKIDPAGLSRAIHKGSFTVNVDGDSTTVPVSLDCFMFQVLEYDADPDEPVVHLLASRARDFPSGQQEDLFLIKYDTRTQLPVDALNLGVLYQSFNNMHRVFTHRQDNRVYVYQRTTGNLIGCNRKRYRIETDVIPAGPQFSTICGAGPGRVALLYTNGPAVHDSATGKKLLDAPPGLSGFSSMVAPPSGDRLYCSNTSSFQPILRSFRLSDDRIQSGPAATSFAGEFGRFGISADGMTVFLRDGYYDRDLRLLGRHPGISAVNSDGSLFLLSPSSDWNPSEWVTRDGTGPERPSVKLYLSQTIAWSPVNHRLLVRVSPGAYHWLDPYARKNLGLPYIPGGEWIAQGNRPWIRDTSAPEIIRSGRLGDPSIDQPLNSTYLSFKSPTGGRLAFDWRNLTNGKERFSVSMNGSSVAVLDASTEWQSRTFEIPAGATLAFSYRLPNGTSRASPTAELRNLSFTPAAITVDAVAAVADSDGDGIGDLLEAALGSDPGNCNCRPVYGVEGDPAAPMFRYQRPAGAAWSYRVQISEDLRKWTDLPGSPVIETHGVTESVTHALPPGRARSFVRVSVTPPAS